MEIKRVGVVGAGLMGVSLAHVFASNPDLQVRMYDQDPEKEWYQPMAHNLDLMVAKGAATVEEKERILSSVSMVSDLEQVAKDADFIIESVPEVMEIKQELFRQLESYCSPKTIFATNTSVMSPTEIFSLCHHPERGVGAHFWNPGHLIPLVEVVKARHTLPEVIDATMALMTACGKKPIYCQKDVPGFVANRLQHALWREAFYMVEEGIADPKTVDDACKYGPGLRWPILGPMENSDMVGIDLSYNIHAYILQHLADNHTPSPCLQAMLDQGHNGFGTGQGWQKWTAEAIENSNNNLRNHLVDCLSESKNQKQPVEGDSHE